MVQIFGFFQGPSPQTQIFYRLKYSKMLNKYIQFLTIFAGAYKFHFLNVLLLPFLDRESGKYDQIRTNTPLIVLSLVVIFSESMAFLTFTPYTKYYWIVPVLEVIELGIGLVYNSRAATGPLNKLNIILRVIFLIIIYKRIWLINITYQCEC